MHSGPVYLGVEGPKRAMEVREKPRDRVMGHGTEDL